MKPLKTKDLREMKTEELETLNQERRRQAFDLRFQHYTGQLTNTASLSKTRRNVARLETLIRERQHAAAAE